MHALSSPAAAVLPRVLIVDDSVVARTVISRMVENSARFAVAGVVGSAAAALEFVDRERVDLILLDVNMPGMDGLTALPQLLSTGQGARVVIVSSATSRGADATVRALALGAADTIEKPAAIDMSGRFATALVERLERLTARRFPPARSASPAKPPRIAPEEAAFDIVLIGASTGGIHALSTVLDSLPASFRQPVVITQHLPAAFMPYFTAQLATRAGRPCDVATDRMRLRPGRIVVAPGDAHVRCVSIGDGVGAIRLSHDRATSGCLPSVDPMFASAADAFGARTLAIVLTGMGRDGAEGARRIHDVGGCIVVQDEASSVVWGMPGAVAAQGIADAILPPAAIARLLVTGQRA